MKYKKFSLILLVISIQYSLFAQSASLKIDSKKDTLLYIYIYGKFNPNHYDPCTETTRIKYGYDFKAKAGCVVKIGDARRWKRHNKRVEKKLIKRNGIDWKIRYEDDVKECENASNKIEIE